ncbi:anaerobic ribonucleoside-triphosphate reductase activating protein [Flagellimonas pacifica]|uniref:Anaerobic ribonucleoside-triphosphate reductase activating protein n=1 Tax=Flagellimonas pacifica TaxID=1247520 RepID=A0A285MWI8_9FLAO|nr:anaerobic ribonucleoside-triphosphate reductase activating protein [Allomuricauda parva]SNZ01478.1 anaerobic ribonucleoside-triphosphate reductase activating protein [Allomuricauda parva]
MYFNDFQIVLQEVPGEVSLCLTISGCPHRCEGCHSPFLWKEGSGQQLTHEIFRGMLYKYYGFATCVVFMGGEWHQAELIENLRCAKDKGYKTCLYTGLEKVDKEILKHLTWIKTGQWITARGGLDSKSTNQKFIEVKTNKILNHLFIKK